MTRGRKSKEAEDEERMPHDQEVVETWDLNS